MSEIDDLDWRSFADIASPEAMAQAMLDIYGETAGEAAAACSRAAQADRRMEDHQYWFTVLHVLTQKHGVSSAPTTTH